ncbi:HAD-IIA family hydrolase [Chondrinema litorale]|uniref:HAD-IIA family hydrolase n=1 Tax=Chondrinema litorale TaxID=2994555 RepID=UPI0025433297|nr:HAD-IIA family hydrolase [Chondrinema litorale]UZR98206.1 HAD-IIA family hydrolase [Chondrinema litorale]
MISGSFREIVEQYEVVFFDSFGVLRNYDGIIPGVEKTFAFLRENNIDFYILTNDASRGPKELASKFQDMGLEEITRSKIISSGMLARNYLRNKVKNGTVTFLGTEKSAHYIETAGLKTLRIQDLSLKDIDHINAMVLLDDEGYDWQDDVNKAINLLRMRNMPVIVANTDLTYPVSKGKIALAVGALADMIETIVQKNFIRFGKPDTQMFNFAYEYVLNTRLVDKNKILMVGDTLETDIIGGNKFGIDTTLVLTGNTPPEKAKMNIESTGIIPDYICSSAAV